MQQTDGASLSRFCFVVPTFSRATVSSSARTMSISARQRRQSVALQQIQHAFHARVRAGSKALACTRRQPVHAMHTHRQQHTSLPFVPDKVQLKHTFPYTHAPATSKFDSWACPCGGEGIASHCPCFICGRRHRPHHLHLARRLQKSSRHQPASKHTINRNTSQSNTSSLHSPVYACDGIVHIFCTSSYTPAASASAPASASAKHHYHQQQRHHHHLRTLYACDERRPRARSGPRPAVGGAGGRRREG